MYKDEVRETSRISDDVRLVLFASGEDNLETLVRQMCDQQAELAHTIPDLSIQLMKLTQTMFEIMRLLQSKKNNT